MTFVHVGKDAMRPVFETLRGAGWNAYLNPGAKEARTIFTVGSKTVVVRFTRAPDHLPEDHLMRTEDVLVELFQESKHLSLMDLGESETVAGHLIEAGRIDMGSLALVIAQRKVENMKNILKGYTILEND